MIYDSLDQLSRYAKLAPGVWEKIEMFLAGCSPETQNGRVFRLGGQGMPKMGKAISGDIKAKVNVVLPVDLTDEEKELFQKLNRLRNM